MSDEFDRADYLANYTFRVHALIEEVIYPTRDYLEEPKTFYYTILFKLNLLLDSSSLLLKNIQGKPHYIASLFLILRTCMLDLINICYILDAQGDKEQQIWRLDLIYSSHIKALLKSDENYLQQAIAEHPKYFKDGKFNNTYQLPTSHRMVTEISGDLKKHAESALINYNIFSKVEHNGIMSFAILHNFYSPQNFKVYECQINIAIALSVLMIDYVLLKWVHIDDPRYMDLSTYSDKLIRIPA